MGDSSYKGVSASQDSRFSNKESALLRKLKFPAQFETKVDMTKVELSVIKPWIARRITELLGFEDDVVLEYAAGMLEEERWPDPKKVQIQLMGFLEEKTAEFMAELWELLRSAQESPGGVPKRFVEEKKEELRRKREEGEKVVREARERAQRAAAEGDRKDEKRKSRWDAGAPQDSPATNVEQPDTRPPRYGERKDRDSHRLPPRDDYHRPEEYRRNDRDRPRGVDSYRHSSSFRERDGHLAERSRDSGWGSRAPSRQADTWRPSCSSRRRSPSPPPRPRRRSPSPPPRRRHRSRSRSVTPDYRASLREKLRNQPAVFNWQDNAEEAEEDAYERDAKQLPSRDMESDDTESDDSRAIERKRQRKSRSDLSSDNDEYQPPSSGHGASNVSAGRHKETERERERELRNKLLRAKSSQASAAN